MQSALDIQINNIIFNYVSRRQPKSSDNSDSDCDILKYINGTWL